MLAAQLMALAPVRAGAQLALLAASATILSDFAFCLLAWLSIVWLIMTFQCSNGWLYSAMAAVSGSVIFRDVASFNRIRLLLCVGNDLPAG